MASENEKFPSSEKGNAQYIHFCISVITDFGAGKVTKDKFIPFEIKVSE